MKILLACPPHSLIDRYGKNIAKAAGVLPPLGVLYLAAYLKKNGHDVFVVDGSVDSYQTLMSAIKEKRPDVVGVSAPTFLWRKTVRLLEEVKALFPEIFLVVGGPHPTFFPKQCFIDSPSLDAVVMGEGEITLLELCRALESRASLDGIAGLAFRTKDKETRINRSRDEIKDIDELPFPARELIDISKYKPALQQYKILPVTSIMGSRGCPFQCIFCAHVTGNKTRYRSPQNIVNEIRFLVDHYGIREIGFWDDTMTVDKSRVIELCQMMKRENLGVIWSAQARVNTVDPEMLSEMKSAGCWKIFFGVESLMQKNLDALKKGTTTSQAINAIKWTRKAGIETEASFIFGIPGETYGEAKAEVREMIKLDPDYMKCFPLTPIPGAELYEHVAKYGKMLTQNFDDFTENKVVFVPYTMTQEQLIEVVSYTYKKFYLRPSYILKRLSRIKSIEDVRKSIRGIRAIAGM
jgi:anaerobic magnesium-protoporphyrin IX monomethyl ester cyclase